MGSSSSRADGWSVLRAEGGVVDSDELSWWPRGGYSISLELGRRTAKGWIHRRKARSPRSGPHCRTAALEGAEHGLTVNAVAPGWMDTGIMRSQLAAQSEYRGMSVDEVVAHFRAQQPGNRFVDVSEVAEVVGFLVSPAASAVNGVCIPVDHGTSARG